MRLIINQRSGETVLKTGRWIRPTGMKFSKVVLCEKTPLTKNGEVRWIWVETLSCGHKSRQSTNPVGTKKRRCLECE